MSVACYQESSERKTKYEAEAYQRAPPIGLPSSLDIKKASLLLYGQFGERCKRT
jgi:hypothetical protein